MGVALTDQLQAEVYDPFSQGAQAYIGAMDVEIGFASTRKTTEAPYDQDDLAKEITKVCFGHPLVSSEFLKLTCAVVQ
jgi:vesicle-fusing ATPase